mgnify:CR=1 FL=1
MPLTESQFIWTVLGAMSIIVVGTVLVFWIMRRYPPVKKTKTVPLYWAFVIWIMLLLGYGIIVLLGIRTQEDAKADVKWLIISLFVLMIFFSIVSYFTNRPIPSYKLWKEYVLVNVKKYWGAEPYIGEGYFTGMIFHKVIDLEKSPQAKKYLADMGKTSEKIDVFYGNAFFGNVFPFLAGVNKYTGEDLIMARPPILTVALIQLFLGEELVSSFAPELSKYATEEEGIAHPQQHTGVKT